MAEYGKIIVLQRILTLFICCLLVCNCEYISKLTLTFVLKHM